MGLGETDLLEDDGRGDAGMSFAVAAISCSICLEAVKDKGDRSTAKLQCGHEFHLDCIGSAFNAKGVMQCPNCRKIEKGQWLYSNGYRSFQEYNMDDWTYEEDLYDPSYSEMPFSVHWCPFGGLARLPSSFEEGESQSIAYHDLLGHHAIFAEHSAASLVAHSCPYAAYFQPLHPLSSNSAENAADGPAFHHHWSGHSVTNDIPTSHPFPGADLHYHSWDHQSLFPPTANHINGIDSSATVRSTRVDSDGHPRTRSFMHPYLLSHGSGSRVGSSVISSMVPPYPGNSRAHSHTSHGLQVYHQSNSSGVRAPIPSSIRRLGTRGLAPVGPTSSSSDHSSLYVFPSSGPSVRSHQDVEGSGGNRFLAWERDCLTPFPLVAVDREAGWWGPFASGSDAGSRTGGIWHRHGSDRPSSQGWAESTSYQPVHHHTRMHPFM
ncbi:zinc finger protein [Cinnamomum micranthum f. kanehirae]|uniref:Zinc finger protein n=1 Tax=Cinnamomum micranthum f. kanehirae TaxID=337451 RepID=A0A3S4PTD6_9MAGN|nr:zinc finger protein [Cinnamomum micranthum f. kanehirae]